MGNLKEGAVIYRKMVEKIQKLQRKTCFKGLSATILIFMMFCILQISMVSSATWTSNFNNNLLVWWDFDNLGSGNLTDIYNGVYDYERQVVNGSPFEVTGKINTARRFNNTGNYNYSHHNIEELNRNFTFSILW